MAKNKSKQNQTTQYHFDRWADLMKRIVKNPEIADRIPNNANLLFGEGDLIFINGEPQRYSELVKTVRRPKSLAKRQQPRAL